MIPPAAPLSAPVIRAAQLIAVAAFAIGCGGAPDPAPSPGLAGAPPAAFDADESVRRHAAEQTAARDFECTEDVRVVAVLPRKYSNDASLRYVIEGCEKRGTYLEDCHTFTCRYLLVSVVPIGASKPSAPAPP
jgi:hypothetical protein